MVVFLEVAEIGGQMPRQITGAADDPVGRHGDDQ